MKTPKREATYHVTCLPESALLDDVLYRLAFVQSVNEGIAEAERGEFANQEEVERRMAKWLKSAGR